MLESLKHEELQFQELTPEEKQSRGILARLTGPIASFTKGTRNGRKYSDKLWEKAFDSPLVKEMFKNGGLPGELQHPENRSETDPTKIAIMMPEPPKKDAKGHLVASVDILDTPCGQIAYQLGKYGFKFGISSRGEGDLITDFSGEESVDPDTYTLNAFDLVLIPACEDARLQFNESLNTKKNNKLRTILGEALANASDTDRRIMEEALDELNIDDNWRFVETYEDNDIFYDPSTKNYIVGDLDSYTILNSLKNAKEYIDRYNPDGQFFKEEMLNEEQIDREETKPATSASEILKNKPQPEKAIQPIQPVQNEQPEISVTVAAPENNEKEDNVIKEDKNSNKKRAFWDTDFHRLDVAYNHNFKKFEDMEAESGMIRDLIDDLEAQGKNYDIYEHKTDPGCTVFFEESLKEDVWDDLDFYSEEISLFMDKSKKNYKIVCDFVDNKLNKPGENIGDLNIDELKKLYNYITSKESLNEAIEWDDLNGTEQSAVETALVEISNGSTIEDAVHGAVAMYNEENANSDYENEDFYMEEADYQKVFDYVKSHESKNESLTEANGNDPHDYVKLEKPYRALVFHNGEVSISSSRPYDDADYYYAAHRLKDPDNVFVICRDGKIVEKVKETTNDNSFQTVVNRLKELDSSVNKHMLYDSLNEAKYTRDELLDKFGTDDLDIINAGNEEVVELAADDDGAIVEQFQKVLKHNKSLEEKIKTLQEKISVGYAKEIDLKEEIENYKQQLSKLSEKTKEIKVLTEKLYKAEKLLEDNRKNSKDSISTLNESILSKDATNKKLEKNISNLNEAVDRKNSKIRSLNEQISKYKDELCSKDNDIEQLKEQYETGQKDLEQLKNQYSKKLEQQNQIIEKYQRVAKNSVKKYIESQAVKLGVKSDEIINRLPKNYSFKDIDIICEDLQEYKFNMSNLPFSQYGLNENLKVAAKNIDKGLIEANPEDEITDYDLKIAEAFL